jgi:hypothetical protein
MCATVVVMLSFNSGLEGMLLDEKIQLHEYETNLCVVQLSHGRLVGPGPCYKTREEKYCENDKDVDWQRWQEMLSRKC